MEVNRDEVKSCFIISKSGVFSFQWKIHNFFKVRGPIQSPTFFYKNHCYPWFLKLDVQKHQQGSDIKLGLHSNSNDDIDLKFSITLVHNYKICTEQTGIWYSFSKFRPVPLMSYNGLDRCINDILSLTCTIEVIGPESVSHTKTVTILHPNLNYSESQSDRQSTSNQINNVSGKTEGKKQVAVSTVIFENSDDSPDFETMKQLLIDFKKMLAQTMNTDVAIQVEDTAIQVHKAVLSARSPVFRQMFEHSSLETVKGEIEVTDIRVSIMKKLINYLYCGEKGRLQYEEACELYYAADKYEILCLRKACMKDLLSLLDVNNACPTLSLAYRHNDDAFKELIMDFICANFKPIVNTESWVELTDKDTKLAALLMRYCASDLVK